MLFYSVRFNLVLWFVLLLFSLRLIVEIVIVFEFSVNCYYDDLGWLVSYNVLDVFFEVRVVWVDCGYNDCYI